MPLMPIYRDFFRFLDASGAGVNLWQNYEELYFAPHREFLASFLENCLGLDLDALRERVESVKSCHYSHLLSLLESYDLEGMCLSTLRKCDQMLHWTEEPTVYLMVGFFSPDGFVLPIGDKPVIGIGLERYRSFRNLPVILSHECCHYTQLSPFGCAKPRLPHPKSYIQSSEPDEYTLKQAMLREGACILFSRLIVPDRPLNEHLGISRGRLNWMKANESVLRQVLEPALHITEKNTILQYIYGYTHISDDAVVSKVGSYIGFRMAEEFITY